MPRFLIQYKHVEETTYEEWVEAPTEAEAITKIEEDPSFNTEDVTDVSGVEVKDIEVIDEQEDEEEDLEQ